MLASRLPALSMKARKTEILETRFASCKRFFDKAIQIPRNASAERPGYPDEARTKRGRSADEADEVHPRPASPLYLDVAQPYSPICQS
jgi:hypothetical protein